jgi:DnaJ-class molecular chaperone
VRNPYDVLGVARTATPDEIKKAYRKLAKKLHPDVNPGNTRVEQQFKEVSAAHDLLSDPVKRGQFDRGEIDANGAERPSHGFYRGPSGRAGERSQSFEIDDELPIDDLFSSLFGQRRGGRNMRMRGADATYAAEVDFVEAALGARKRLTLTDGKTLDVTIPPGTEHGQTLRLKGQGMAGASGGNAGDAYIEIRIAPHPVFTRDGTDVRVDVPISLPEAVLGATITVATIDGSVSLKVPPGSNTGTTLRLRGKGIPDRRTKQRGDEYVTLKVMLPEPPDSDLREFVESWAKRRPYEVRRDKGRK